MKIAFVERPDGVPNLLHEERVDVIKNDVIFPRRGEVVDLYGNRYRVSEVIHDLIGKEIKFICAKIPNAHYLPSNT